MAGDWLNLSETASLLGVHSSTVRNWADQGRLPVHRTKGGHRRFRRSEVDLWTQSQRAHTAANEADLVVQSALGRTRFKISEGQLEAEVWFQKIDDNAREQYRRSGRALLQGLTAYLASNGAIAQAEAQALGFEYATIARRCGLSSVDAISAFLFFRNVLVESMVSVYESAAIQSPYAWSDMLRKITTFTDQVLLALLENYQIFQDNRR